MADNGVVAGGRLTDWVSLGVLAAFVPRDVVDDAVAAAGKQARRSDGKLPPHVMVYFVMALALFADDDYEEVAARLTETLAAWGCWDDSWSVPTSGGITQARQRLGYEPLEKLFGEVAAPVAEELTAGAFLGNWRLMAIDGFEWDVPDTPQNAAAFGFPGSGKDDQPAYPKVRVVTVSECASHAVVDAAMGGVATGAMLAIARIAGETAPLLFTALSYTYMSTDVMNPIASLTYQIYYYAGSPYEQWHAMAWAATTGRGCSERPEVTAGSLPR